MERMISRRRLPLLVAVPAAYVGIAALREDEARPSSLLLIAIALVIALVGGRIPEGTRPEPARARLLVAVGLSTTIAAARCDARHGSSPAVQPVRSRLRARGSVRVA